MRKKIIYLIVFIFTLPLIFLGSKHVILVLQGKTRAYHIPYINILIKLGKIPESSFPGTISDSFKIIVSPEGDIFREPLFVDNVIIKNESNGDIIASDIRTGEEKLYYWQEDTAYVCVDTRVTKPRINDPILQNYDPKTSIENFHFLFTEYGLRGDQLLSGLSHFESDVSPGTPAKLILKNRILNSDRAFDLLGIFLFIDKDCSDYPV